MNEEAKSTKLNSMSVKERLKLIFGQNSGFVLLVIVVMMILFELVGQFKRDWPGHLVFLSSTNLLLIVRSMLYTGIIAFGMTFVMITGNIDLSVGSQLTMLCSICAVLMMKTDNAFVGIFGTLLIGAMCGAVNGVLVSYLNLNSFITTLGTSSVYTALALMVSAGTVLVIPDTCSAAFRWIGKATFGPFSILVVWFVIVAVLLGLLLGRTVYGQRMYVIGANPVAARFSGIRFKLNTTLAYIITGLCCGLAAAVTMANVLSANPQSGSGKEMEVILCVVLGGCAVNGGKGSVLGTVLGVLLYGVLDNGFTLMNLSTYMRWVVMGLIMVFVLSIGALNERGVKLWKKKK